MPIKYARRLSGRKRSTETNRHLGFALAFVAGATNAGAYLAVKLYTSHMTGMVSSMADNIVLGNRDLALGAFGGVSSFLAGAATTAVMVNFARRRHLHSEFAFPLLLEALLLLSFGLLGAQLSTINGVFVPVTVMLLCFMMGLQNAVITKLSNAVIRTTHLTGIITDMGIELGKLFYWNRHTLEAEDDVVADRDRLRVLVTLTLSFFGGGLFGALGFKAIGYALTVPLALLLVLLAVVPAIDDLRGYLYRVARKRAAGRLD
ncbi:MAG: DUF1275 domain-containing protein [Chlorobiaceae bacterium]|nr:DUF1275 domain-containing protein [Chlorobiaceae bacterium]